RSRARRRRADRLRAATRFRTPPSGGVFVLGEPAGLCDDAVPPLPVTLRWPRGTRGPRRATARDSVVGERPPSTPARQIFHRSPIASRQGLFLRAAPTFQSALRSDRGRDALEMLRPD